MTDTEARVAAALKAELDQIEPSPSSWDVIRNAPPAIASHEDPPSILRAGPALAAAAVVMVLLAATVAVLTGGRDNGGDTVTAGDRLDQPAGSGVDGRVVDETGDARKPHLDLVVTEVRRGAVGDLRIAWTLAGPVPTRGPVGYRVTFIAPDTADRVVVRVRLDGDTPAAAIAHCRADATGAADCTRESFKPLPRPSVRDVTVAITVPAAQIPISLDAASWTAEVLESR